MHVLQTRVGCVGSIVGRKVRILLECRIRNGDVQCVAQRLEVLKVDLLHLVCGVTALERATESVALDGVRQDDRRLTLVLSGGLERCIHLAIVVTTALQVPNLVVRVVLHELQGTRVAAKEVLADECTVLGLVRLEVTVGGDIHQGAQGTVVVAGEKVVPLPTPDDLDDVPPSAAEEALQLLNDLAVTANGAVEALQVAVDDEFEVVESLVGCHLQLAAAFHLVHFSVAQKGPDVLVRRVLNAAVREIAVELRLVDSVDGAEAH